MISMSPFKCYSRMLISSFGLRSVSSKIPVKPVITIPVRDPSLARIKIDKRTVRLIEKLALVKFSDEEGIAQMEELINFVDPLREVDTTNIEPMISVLEDRSLHLRDDVPEETDRKQILMNASKLEEDYFVAPPGNVPLSIDEDTGVSL